MLLLEECPLNLAETEAKICLSDVTWEQYETLLKMFGERRYLRLNYLAGALEIMTTSLQHEMLKKIITRLLEIYQGLQIKEIWFWEVDKKQFTIYQLQDNSYKKTEQSYFFQN